MDLSSWLKRRYLWVGLIVEGLLLLYMIGGFFVIPWWIRGEVVSTARETYELEVNPMFEVYFNPFTFEIGAADGQIRDNEENVLSFRSVSADFEPTNSLLYWTWTVDRLQADSLRVLVRRGETGQLNWSTILDRASTKNQNKSDTDSSGVGPLYLDSFRLNKAHVRWEDRSREPEASVSMKQISVRGDTLDWPSSDPMDFHLEARVDDEGKLDSTLTWHPGDPRVEARVQLGDVPLKIGNDYFRRYVKAHWSSGRLNFTGHATVRPQSSSVNLDSSLDIREARMDHESDTQLAGWDRLSVDTVALNTLDREMDIQGITLNEPYLRFVVADGYETNFQKLLRKNVAEKKDPEVTQTERSDDWALSVGPGIIRSASIYFRDDNVLGSFRTRMHDLGGTVTQLGSPGSQAASIDLKGQTDQQGQASLTGTINPFGASPRLDLELDIKDIAMVSLSPYVVKFAGYRVDQGKLHLNLQYRLRNNQLSGSNQAVLNKFRLGKRESGNPVFNLPVNLVIALLKDKNGVIDLDVPVEGDLSNPQFELGPVMRRAVSRVLSNIVTSPFQFLANLVDAEAEQLRNIDFEPGQPGFSDDAEHSIRKLTEALKKRPELNLEIRPVRSTADYRMLAQRRTDEMIAEAGGTPENLVGSLSAVEDVYRQTTSRSTTDELRMEHTEKAEGELYGTLNEQDYVRALYERVVDQVDISDKTLNELARDRARNLRDRFRSLDIDVDRLFILDVQNVESPIDQPVELPLSPRA